MTVHLFGPKHSASNYGAVFSCYSVCVVLNLTVMAEVALPFHLASQIVSVVVV